MGKPKLRKTEAVLPGNEKSTVSTEIRIYELTDRIVNSGWSRMDILQYVKDTWGLSDTQAQRYWMAAVNYLRPKDPEKYREAMINKNIDLLETIIRRALASNNLKEANNAIKTLNSMLGAGGKQVEIADKDAAGEDRKIVISFND